MFSLPLSLSFHLLYQNVYMLSTYFFLIVFLTSFPDKTKGVSFLWKHTRKHRGRNLGCNFIFQATGRRWNTLIMRNREKAVVPYCKDTVQACCLSTELIFISFCVIVCFFSDYQNKKRQLLFYYHTIYKVLWRTVHFKTSMSLQCKCTIFILHI